MSKFYAAKYLYLLLTFLLLTGPLPIAASPCTLTDAAFRDASGIRGLAGKTQVPCLLYNKKKIRQHLLEIVDTKISPEKIRYEEMYFKALGIIPRDYNYKDGVINLYVSQLGGYYDAERNHYVMASWLPESLQHGIAVHELTHALQDQYYNLDSFMDVTTLSSDTLLAHSALVEGDASAVMADYVRRLERKPGIETADDVEALVSQTIMGTSMIAEQSKAPKSLLSLMLFPYTSGLRFVHVLLKSGGYEALDGAFANPPNSSRDILHPHLYLQGETSRVIIPEEQMTTGKNSEVLLSDEVGEYTVRVMFEALGYTEKRATSFAEGWVADRILVLKNDRGQPELLWKSLWKSSQEAQEFCSALSVLKKHDKNVSISKQNQAVILKINPLE
ncbi:MAG: hypothetical protein KDD62_12300 [Bdellovibrionales bacterium]|nr:hypothetical protein [Bdellovibrionales bacterium]